MNGQSQSDAGCIDAWRRLPAELIRLVLAFEGSIKPRGGRYMDQLRRDDPRYALLAAVPRPLLLRGCHTNSGHQTMHVVRFLPLAQNHVLVMTAWHGFWGGTTKAEYTVEFYKKDPREDCYFRDNLHLFFGPSRRVMQGPPIAAKYWPGGSSASRPAGTAYAHLRADQIARWRPYYRGP